jgi:rhodanese-related sulfurtransferase
MSLTERSFLMSISLPTLDVYMLAAALEGNPADTPLLLDVREDHEIAICAIPHHIHIPLAQIPHAHEQLPKDRMIAVYCHHGRRSAMAVEYLQALGYQVCNITGGIHAWATHINPDMPTY